MTRVHSFSSLALFQDAVVTADLVEKIIKEDSKTKPLLPLQLIRHREIQLPGGKFRRRENSEDVYLISTSHFLRLHWSK